MPTVIERPFGEIGEFPARQFELSNAQGMVARVTEYGATLTHLWVPDSKGHPGDVVLGFESLDEYSSHPWYFGGTVGRVANRIKNGRFKLGNQTYHLNVNDGNNHLHGGKTGWDKRLWRTREAEVVSTDATDVARIIFSYVSPDGEEGYPGEVSARVMYALGDDNTLTVTMQATSEQQSVVNMAHHSYWDLSAGTEQSILNHELELYADEYTPGVDGIPEGLVAPVAGTPFDFNRGKRIGSDIVKLANSPLGYDHNFIVRGEANTLRKVAAVSCAATGRKMTLAANQPGVQFYSGNYLDGTRRGKGRPLTQHAGFCLETQAFPNAIRVPEWRSQVILEPEHTYHHEMVHTFEW